VAGEAYETALKENNIEAVSRPNIEVKQIEKGKDLIFTAVVETKPEAKLGKYKGIEIPKIEYNVTEESIEAEEKEASVVVKEPALLQLLRNIQN
jgi:trigger factor